MGRRGARGVEKAILMFILQERVAQVALPAHLSVFILLWNVPFNFSLAVSGGNNDIVETISLLIHLSVIRGFYLLWLS